MISKPDADLFSLFSGKADLGRPAVALPPPLSGCNFGLFGQTIGIADPAVSAQHPMIPANFGGGLLVNFRDETAQHGGRFYLPYCRIFRQSFVELWQLTGLNIKEKETWSFVR